MSKAKPSRPAKTATPKKKTTSKKQTAPKLVPQSPAAIGRWLDQLEQKDRASELEESLSNLSSTQDGTSPR